MSAFPTPAPEACRERRLRRPLRPGGIGLLVWSLVGALFTLWATAAPSAPVAQTASTVGEKATYSVRYGPLSAGTITLESQARGERIHLTGQARSSRLLNLFYRVDDRIETIVDATSGLPRSQTLQIEESKERGTRQVLFDRVALRAVYLHWDEPVDDAGLAAGDPRPDRREDAVLARGALDAFAALHALRRQDLRPGRTVELPVHENRKNWSARIRVGEARTLRTALGAIEALPLRIEARLGGRLATDRDLTAWVSADSRRILLRFTASLRFGSIRADLASYRGAGATPS